MTLTDFLLARIAEDEIRADALRSITSEPRWTTSPDGRVLSEPPPWVDLQKWIRAECEAKRRLIQAHETNCCGYHDWPIEGVAPGRADRAGVDVGLWHAIRVAALPHADHPDYREGWKP